MKDDQRMTPAEWIALALICLALLLASSWETGFTRMGIVP